MTVSTSSLYAIRRWRHARADCFAATEKHTNALADRNQALGTPAEASAQVTLDEASNDLYHAQNKEQDKLEAAEHACKDEQRERELFNLLHRLNQQQVTKEQEKALEELEEKLDSNEELSATDMLLEVILGPDPSRVRRVRP